MPTCCTSYVRDWRKRRRYATRADRLVLRQSVWRIESMAPSASLISLTLRFDRQVTASSANTDRATKHFRYQKPFFKQTGCINGLLPARARLYPKPYPTLPNPAPLPPRAFRLLKIPAAGRLCLKFVCRSVPPRESVPTVPTGPRTSLPVGTSIADSGH
jgi:hypothetical protein